MELTQDRVQWQGLELAVLNLGVMQPLCHVSFNSFMAAIFYDQYFFFFRRTGFQKCNTFTFKFHITLWLQ